MSFLFLTELSSSSNISIQNSHKLYLTGLTHKKIHTHKNTNWQSHSHYLCALICGEPQTLTQLLIFMWCHLTPIYHKIKLQHLSLSCCFFKTETRNAPWNRTAVENAYTHTHTHNLKPVILSHTSLNPCQIMNEPLTNPVISLSRLSLWKSAICKETFGEPLCPYSFFWCFLWIFLNVRWILNLGFVLLAFPYLLM